MNSFFFPLRYLRLEGSRGNKLIHRDFVPVFIVAAILSAPFIFVPGANFAHDKGFLDRVGTFLAVLTGFYFAGLIAVASLSSHFADLDKPITVGEVRLPNLASNGSDLLSRRQYVCYMFGYMAFVSIVLSVLCLVGVVISSEVGLLTFTVKSFRVDHEIIRASVILIFSLPLGSLLITTLRGLYYLVERLYDEESIIDNTRSPDDA
jgi:hypothetical protein